MVRFVHHRPEACSIRRGCEVIELPRSTFYYRASEAGTVLSDLQVVQFIESIRDELPGYGYRRVTDELRRRGHLINHKRIARLMKMHGLGIKPRRRFVRTTGSDHGSQIFPNLYRNVILSRPDLVRVATRPSLTWQRDCRGSSKRSTTPNGCTRRSATVHPRIRIPTRSAGGSVLMTRVVQPQGFTPINSPCSG
ncbi:IS3 family transposase [Variovorax paradoxus]|uniref:IS3 family transposase n=1 Tax=Variovorax paradoxus TaxID=34073 RepID=UPI00277E4D0F|nr:IS3 family transposase [Variovorax paradoxus]MDQ0590007.1 transposase InsO family protein [Variovorax paradoxus]